MSSQTRRQLYLQQLVQEGIVPPTGWEGCNTETWLDKFFAPKKPILASKPRLVNNFNLGADPEFVFFDDAGRRVAAEVLGLKTGLFCGADQNGRLVEARPKPNRSALAVVASLLVEMRWLALLWPNTLGYQWQAGAFLAEDGIGGHVHFGRKRPTRAPEINALDAVYLTTFDLGMWPIAEQERRQAGDQFRQRYGQLTDFRPQAHGYEYRTFPSWLDSPALAFITLTLAKLAVYNPALVFPWHQVDKTISRARMLTNLLAYYKGKDDDAALAYNYICENGWPVHIGGDFKGRWGLNFTTYYPVENEGQLIYPSAIAPTSAEIAEVFNLLAAKIPLTPKQPVINWSPAYVPEGFRLLLSRLATAKRAGFGELLYDACELKTLSVDILTDDGGVHDPENETFAVSAKLANMLQKGWKEKLTALGITATVKMGNKRAIWVGKGLRKPTKLSSTRRVLLKSGIFPLWKVSEATAELAAPWQTKPEPKPAGKFRGQLLYPAEGTL